MVVFIRRFAFSNRKCCVVGNLQMTSLSDLLLQLGFNAGVVRLNKLTEALEAEDITCIDDLAGVKRCLFRLCFPRCTPFCIRMASKGYRVALPFKLKEFVHKMLNSCKPLLTSLVVKR